MRSFTIYTNLLNQFEKVAKHNRQGSFRTRHRYQEGFKRFLKYLADHYRLERIANIRPKHLYAYTGYLVENGKSTAYIKTELSAIRFYHDQIPNAKYRLPSNSDLNLARRKYGGTDRTWSSREFNRYLAKADQLGREDYVTVLCLARYAALRLHECFRIDTQTANQAVKAGEITIRGKGGLVRTVPINQSIEIQLKKMLAVTPKGHKLFVASNDKTHNAMHRMEDFIYHYKGQLQDADSHRPLTFHGLRHTCAAEWYQERINQGMSELEARRVVAQLLGHGRDSVTHIYLASLHQPDSYRTTTHE